MQGKCIEFTRRFHEPCIHAGTIQLEMMDIMLPMRNCVEMLRRKGSERWRPAKTCGVTVSDAWRGNFPVDSGITTTSVFSFFLFVGDTVGIVNCKFE